MKRGAATISIIVALVAAGVIADAAFASDRVSIAGAEQAVTVSFVSANGDPAPSDELSTSVLIIATPDRMSRVATSIEGASDAAAAGDAALADAEGKTLDDTAPARLREDLERLRSSVGAVESALHGDRSADAARSVVWASSSAGSLADALDSGASDLEDLAAAVDASITGLAAAVDAWQVEQDRLASEARAAEERALAAAAQAAADAASASNATSGTGGGDDDGATGGAAAPGSPGGASADRNQYVWTSGFQAELDACNGAVDLSGTYGVRVIGEHWHCGGAAFPTWSGAIVDLSGVVSGRFRVEGIAAVLDGATADSNDIPGGYDLLYQTCLNDSQSQMAFVGLTRIG